VENPQSAVLSPHPGGTCGHIHYMSKLAPCRLSCAVDSAPPRASEVGHPKRITSSAASTVHSMPHHETPHGCKVNAPMLSNNEVQWFGTDPPSGKVSSRW
jgi:hypothetical protein